MTGKERILNTINGKQTDRVPVGLFVQEEYLGYYFPGRKPDRVRDGAECAKELGFDLMTRANLFNTPYFLKKHFANWKPEKKEYVEKGNFYRQYIIETPTRTLRQTEVGPDAGLATGGIHMATTEYLLKDEDDVAAFCEYVPEPDDNIKREVRDYCELSRQIIGDIGVAAPWGMGGVYNLASTYMDVQTLMINAYEEDVAYTTYMEKICSLACAFDGFFASENREIIGIQGNIANGGMVGRTFFDEYILPYEKRLVDAIHDNGALTLYHNCGKALNLYDSYVAMGLDVWETVAEAPQGDNILAEAKQHIGSKLTLMGNIDQIYFLKNSSPLEVAKRTEAIVHIGKPGGRYIFAASDYLEANTPVENVKAMIAAAKSAGVY